MEARANWRSRNKRVNHMLDPTDTSKAMRVSVVLPTYNERENIAELLERIAATLGDTVDHEIIVVDDDSPDGTAEAINTQFGQNQNIRLHVRKNERGLATAIRKGIELSTGSVIVVMDSDFNHDPKYIPQFLNLTQYYEVVVGSRFLYGGGMYSQWRYYASFLYNVFIRFFLGLPIRDKLSGFFAARSETLQRLDYDHIFYGYGDYFIRFLMTIVDLKLSLIEVPVFYNNRPAGESKTMFLKEFMRYTVSAVRIRFGSKSARQRKNPPIKRPD